MTSSKSTSKKKYYLLDPERSGEDQIGSGGDQAEVENGDTELSAIERDDMPIVAKVAVEDRAQSVFVSSFIVSL